MSKAFMRALNDVVAMLPLLQVTPEQTAKAERQMRRDREAFLKRRAERDTRWDTRR